VRPYPGTWQRKADAPVPEAAGIPTIRTVLSVVVVVVVVENQRFDPDFDFDFDFERKTVIGSDGLLAGSNWQSSADPAAEGSLPLALGLSQPGVAEPGDVAVEGEAVAAVAMGGAAFEGIVHGGDGGREIDVHAEFNF